MPGRPYILAETTWQTVRETRYDVAVLPWGATEAHNYHLPYGTDVFETEAIAAESARIAWEQGAKVTVLPTMPFGVQTGQLDIRLDCNLNPSTQLAVLSDLAHALDGQGIPKLVIINGHGGNDFRAMIRELQPRVRLFLSAINWYTVVDGARYFAEPGDHGGELETSVTMHIAPELVLPLDQAGSGAVRRPKLAALREGWAWAPRPWTKVTADTGVGNPKQATPEKGARYVEAVTRKIAGYLVELAGVDVEQLYD